jgi:hypothetical protein
VRGPGEPWPSILHSGAYGSKGASIASLSALSPVASLAFSAGIGGGVGDGRSEAGFAAAEWFLETRGAPRGYRHQV